MGNNPQNYVDEYMMVAVVEVLIVLCICSGKLNSRG